MNRADLISVLIYIVFLAGIVILEAGNIRVLVKRRRLRHRLAKGEQEGRLSAWCSSLLAGAFGRNIDGVWLIAAETLVFLSAFIVSVRSFNLFAALLISLIISGFPLLLIYSRLRAVQDRGSKEAVSLVTEFYRQYRISGLNVFEAIEKTIASPGDFPVCRKQLSLLLIRLRDSAGRSDIRDCCRRFGFAMGTSWGRMLGGCIEIAAVKGTDISAAIADIMDQLKESKTQLEERKRLNGEAVRMTLFLVPLLYAGTVAASVRYLGIGLPRFLHNQFFTTEGMLFFTVSVLLFFINILLLGLVNNGRFDF